MPATKSATKPEPAEPTTPDTSEAPEAEKVVREAPVKLFKEGSEHVLLDELPGNAVSRGGDGGFTAQWKNDLERLFAEIPEGKWTPIKEYQNSPGARMVQREMDPVVYEDDGKTPKLTTRKSPKTGKDVEVVVRVKPDAEGRNIVGPEFLKKIELDTDGRVITTAVRRADVDGKRKSTLFMKWNKAA